MDIETRLRELMLPVFALDTIEEIPPTASLVADLGADSLDFVEIIYLVEQNFAVQLATKTLFLGGQELRTEDFFVEGVLAADKADLLREKVPVHADKIRSGMSRAELFGMITVRDLALVVVSKLEAKPA